MPEVRDILGADYTQAEKMVWITILELSGPSGWCVHSQQQIADAMGSSKSFVNRTLAKMEAEGWFTREERKIRCLLGTGAPQAPEGGAQQAPVPNRHRSGAPQATNGAQQAPSDKAENPPFSPSSPSSRPSSPTPPKSPSSQATESAEDNRWSQGSDGSDRATHSESVSEFDPVEHIEDRWSVTVRSLQADEIRQTVTDEDRWRAVVKRFRRQGDTQQRKVAWALNDYENPKQSHANGHAETTERSATRSGVPQGREGGQWGEYANR